MKPEAMKSHHKRRVGLLLCDDVDKAAQPRYGSYTNMFSAGMAAADADCRLTPFRCQHGELPDSPDAFDAYLISGSRHAVYDASAWILDLQDFVRRCYAQRTKTVGICFGHQLIAHALGGETRKAEDGWGVGIHSTRITAPQAWMKNGAAPAPSHYNLVVIHQDQVALLPPGCRVIATNDFCPISMFIADDIMLGIQGHPEFDKDFCAFRIDSRKDTIGVEVRKRAMESLRMDLDSAQIFRWITRFIRG